jgi:signal transduction histidine kinase
MTYQTAGFLFSPVSRETIHDLRNLFGVLTSASRLLAESPAPPTRDRLLYAIDDAAARGNSLTTQLLSQRSRVAPVETFDLNRRILEMVPMLKALLEPGIELRLDLRGERLPVQLEPMGLEAAVIELVMNARAALAPIGHLVLRTRPIGDRVWFLVADDGPGIPAHVPRRLDRGGHPSTGAHGTGLRRVKGFAQESKGRLLMRSAAGRGTTITLILPTAANTAVAKPAVSRRQSPQD